MEWILNLTGWQQALIATTFTWLLTALGAALVLCCKQSNAKTFSFVMSGAAGIMLASAFFSLLLPAVQSGASVAVVATGFAAGGALIILVDVICQKLSPQNKSPRSSCAVMCAAVTLHNIPEGLAVGVAFGACSAQQAPIAAAIMLAVGIGIQNFPEGMCVAFPLRACGCSKFTSFTIGQLSGVVEIFAGVIGALAVTFVQNVLPWSLSFSAGAMLAVVCSELIPESFKNGKIGATLGVVAGFALMMILDLAFG